MNLSLNVLIKLFLYKKEFIRLIVDLAVLYCIQLTDRGLTRVKHPSKSNIRLKQGCPLSPISANIFCMIYIKGEIIGVGDPAPLTTFEVKSNTAP